MRLNILLQNGLLGRVVLALLDLIAHLLMHLQSLRVQEYLVLHWHFVCSLRLLDHRLEGPVARFLVTAGVLVGTDFIFLSRAPVIIVRTHAGRLRARARSRIQLHAVTSVAVLAV